LNIAGEVAAVAAELSHSAAQVALAWLLQRPAAGAMPIVGARTLDQFEHNLAALDLALPAEALARLDAISAVAPAFPHDFLQMPLPRMLMSGGTRLQPRALGR
jgi:aryl-alcohol dehydrogenase-like predicted oxidoreductase